MLTRRVVAAATAAAPRSLRAISTTAIQQRAPLIADVTINQVEEFNNKQKQFREKLVQMQKEKEERESSPLRISFFSFPILSSPFFPFISFLCPVDYLLHTKLLFARLKLIMISQQDNGKRHAKRRPRSSPTGPRAC